ncbi:hypothetical protein Q5P01_022928 [Channa striata]|uniref:Claudin n=1 Tax=Channa striata TaxID=64152 RepID=A0AA88RXW2_CHASR|nr:hypothetical protein Q5P01_022928 [Channa striata]
MSVGLDTTGFIMCIISWLVNGAALSNDYWKISSVSGNVITSQRVFENLWHSCAENAAGLSECKDFQTLLNLPVHVQACRALMIICLLLGFGSMITSLFGLSCIKVGSADDQTKGKLAGAGGIMSILAGLCCLTACSWYAYRVVQDFYSPVSLGMKFELGTGLFLGWAGAVLAILGGAFLCCAFGKASSKAKKGGFYGQAPQKIYTAKSEAETARAYV